MRAIIIGRGTIGNGLANFCKKNKIEYKLLSRKNKKIFNYSKTISDQIVLDKKDIVFLSFGISDQMYINKNKKLAYKLNYQYTKKIINDLIKKDISFVFFSSAAVFGKNRKKIYYENSKTCPQTYYGDLKNRIEKHVLVKSKKYYIIRSGWIISKKNNCIIKKIFEQMFNKKCNIFANAKTNMISIENFSKKVFKILKLKSGIYHIPGNNVLRINISNTIKKITNLDYKVINSNEKKFNYYFIISSNKISKVKENINKLIIYKLKKLIKINNKFSNRLTF